jgi:L-threonylcarbamoyladenylate synthase
MVGVESTIVGFDNGYPIIFRLGGTAQEDIESITGPVAVHTTSTSNPKSPGQLQSHYAPGKKVILGNLRELMKQHNKKNVGILSYQHKYDTPFQITLSPSGQITEAAQNLFTALRALDKMPIDIILAETVPDEGLGKAINDRLRRAAG